MIKRTLWIPSIGTEKNESEPHHSRGRIGAPPSMIPARQDSLSHSNSQWHPRVTRTSTSYKCCKHSWTTIHVDWTYETTPMASNSAWESTLLPQGHHATISIVGFHCTLGCGHYVDSLIPCPHRRGMKVLLRQCKISSGMSCRHHHRFILPTGGDDPLPHPFSLPSLYLPIL